MEGINIWAVLLVTAISMAGGALWYGPIFGKKWGEMLGFDKLSQKEMDKMQKEMWRSLLSELCVTLTLYLALAYFIANIPNHSGLFITLLIWLGFVVPVTASTILWSGIPDKQIVPRVLITISFRFIILMVSGYILMIW